MCVCVCVCVGAGLGVGVKIGGQQESSHNTASSAAPENPNMILENEFSSPSPLHYLVTSGRKPPLSANLMLLSRLPSFNKDRLLLGSPGPLGQVAASS